MREFKFRAWNKVECKMCEVFSFCSEFVKVVHEGAGDGVLKFPIQYFVLMQYTGLKDMNRKEIYEGDICSRNGHTYEIHFSEGAFGIKRTDDIMAHINSRYHGHALYNYISELEVIGNIYENQGLLKVA